jgi:hypothetical protein
MAPPTMAPGGPASTAPTPAPIAAPVTCFSPALVAAGATISKADIAPERISARMIIPKLPLSRSNLLSSAADVTIAWLHHDFAPVQPHNGLNPLMR